MLSPSLLHIKHQFTDLKLPILRFLNATSIVLLSPDLYENVLIPGLLRLGGLGIIIEKLSDLDPVIRTSSAWVIGKATQNNPLVQKQVRCTHHLLHILLRFNICVRGTLSFL